MKKKIVLSVTFLLSVMLIVFLVNFIDLKEFGNVLLNIDIRYYLVAMAFYLLAYLVRALRIWTLFDKKYLDRYFLFISIHQVLNRVMPFRTGEIFFPVLIKKLGGNSYAEGIPKLFILRILDIISLAISFLLVCIFVDFGLKTEEYAWVWVFLLVLVLVLFTLKAWFNLFVRIVLIIIPKKHIVRVKAFAEKAEIAFKISRANFWILLFLSVADKFINFIMCFFVLKALSFSFSLPKIISANTMSGLTEILPINSVGSFGTTELGWAGALIYFGEKADIAIASGFGFNLVAFSFTILFGVIALAVTHFIYRINLFKSNEPHEKVG
jgi:uncharacterized membrane protein YbhN (UPF0104 family)